LSGAEGFSSFWEHGVPMTSYKNALIYHDFDFARGLLIYDIFFSALSFNFTFDCATVWAMSNPAF
jgi:hypothetical protein